MAINFGEDYHTNFDPKDYLLRFADVNVPYKVAPLKALYKFYRSYAESAGSNLSVCDIGCGPVIAYVISAARYASEITMSEYTKRNRDEIQLWLDKDPNAHDWTPFFTHIVEQIEGKGPEETVTRQELVRKKIKHIIGSDYMKPRIIDSDCIQYDVVQSFLSLEQSSDSEATFFSTLKKMYDLVKPGGRFVLYSLQKGQSPGPAIYHVRETQFLFLRVTRDFIEKSLKDIGYTHLETIPMTDIPPCDCPDGLCSFTFFIATK